MWEEVSDNKKTNFTIIFVSDGGDNNQHTIAERLQAQSVNIPDISLLNITFLCVGVGAGFPTFLAMKAREIYHNGDQNIPPVFLIENSYSEEEWNTNFQEMSSKLKVTKKWACLPKAR